MRYDYRVWRDVEDINLTTPRAPTFAEVLQEAAMGLVECAISEV